MEASKGKKPRKESGVSETSIGTGETESCILCFNEIKFFALGPCGHTNVCHTCALRMRFILENEQCPMCNADLDEIVITDDKDLTWSFFNKKIKKNCETDPEDDTVYFHSEAAKRASLQLRTLNCMIHNCDSRQHFPNEASLQRHMESAHDRTFCKICLKGRTVFIREQRLYHVKQLRAHIEYGDVGDEKHGEIMPHPYCDFCKEFFFNDLAFIDHINRKHMTCHLCGDPHKNIYYADYASLERHFSQTHHICPYEVCKARCYVAFRTEDELRTHLDIEHKMNSAAASKGAIKANALLGFQSAADEKDDDYNNERQHKEREKNKVIKIMDKEGVDFSYYFGPKYAHILENRRKKNDQRAKEQAERYGGERGGRGRGDRGGRGGRGERGGRGRGRGERGRGRGRGGRDDYEQEEAEPTEKGPAATKKGSGAGLAGIKSSEEKLAALLALFSEFITRKLEKGELKGEYTYHRNQLYQMYFVLSRLDADRFCKLDFIVNFGVAPSTKTEMQQILEQATSDNQVFQFLESVDALTLLKLHKYFFWADKKLHSVFFIENKDQISEDLLIDFKSEEDQEQYRKSEQLAVKMNTSHTKKAQPRTIDVGRAKNTITKEDLLFGAGNSKKLVNIADEEDFPDLEGGGDPFAALDGPAKPKQRPQTRGPGASRKKPQAAALDAGDGQSKAFVDPQDQKVLGGQKVQYAPKKDQRPQTAAAKPHRREAQIRQQKELDQRAKQAGQIAQAAKELEAAERAVRAFDAVPAKTQKQQKKDNKAFPTLEEEKQEASANPDAAGPGGGGKKGGRKKGKAQAAEPLKMGFF